MLQPISKPKGSNATVAYNGTNYTTGITTTTTYIGGIIYESKTYRFGTLNTALGYTDRLQFIGHEEGRIRPLRDAGGGITSFTYDYFVKDHLGNVRMVLTEEQKLDAYEPLSFEDHNISRQNEHWENREGQSINVAGVREQVTMGTEQTNALLVRKSKGAIGATKLLKVMAGDRIHTKVDYYFNAANANNSGTDPVGSFVNSLISSLTHTAVASSLLKGEATAVTSQLQSSSVFTDFINPAPSQIGGNQAPKAYLCVLFFDERFQFDEVSSRVVPVAYAPGVKNTINRTFAGALTAGRNGMCMCTLPMKAMNWCTWITLCSRMKEAHCWKRRITIPSDSPCQGSVVRLQAH